MKNKFNIFIILIVLLVSGCSAVSKKTEVYSKNSYSKGHGFLVWKRVPWAANCQRVKNIILDIILQHTNLFLLGTIVRVTNLNTMEKV